MGVNKVEYGSNTLVDLTSDTVTPDTLLKGITAHNAAGNLIVGTGSCGGHTIINSSGTAVTQRDGLQFSGLNVTDDSANNKTVIQGQVKVCETQAAWNQLSQAEKDDPNTYWFLPWLTNITGSIDDSTTAADKVWSSQKTRTVIDTTQNWIAPPYSSTKTYYANDYFVYNDVLYQVLNFVSQVTGVTPPNSNYYRIADGVADGISDLNYHVHHIVRTGTIYNAPSVSVPSGQATNLTEWQVPIGVGVYLLSCQWDKNGTGVRSIGTDFNSGRNASTTFMAAPSSFYTNTQHINFFNNPSGSVAYRNFYVYQNSGSALTCWPSITYFAVMPEM